MRAGRRMLRLVVIISALSGKANAVLINGTLFTNFISATYRLRSGVPGDEITPVVTAGCGCVGSATAWVIATDPPSLCMNLAKTASPIAGLSGALVCFTISYSNCGIVTAQSVTLTDVFPCSAVRSSLPTLAWGQGGVPSGYWATSPAGPWNSTSPAGKTCPLYLRWILPTVSPHKSGYIKYCVTLQ